MPDTRQAAGARQLGAGQYIPAPPPGFQTGSGQDSTESAEPGNNPGDNTDRASDSTVSGRAVAPQGIKDPQIS